jgi:hypothetical protein
MSDDSGLRNYILLTCGGGDEGGKLVVFELDDYTKSFLSSRLAVRERLSGSPDGDGLYGLEYWFSAFFAVEEQKGLEALNFPEDAEELGREVWQLQQAQVSALEKDRLGIDCCTALVTDDGVYIRFRNKYGSYDFETEVIPASLIHTFESTT